MAKLREKQFWPACLESHPAIHYAHVWPHVRMKIDMTVKVSQPVSACYSQTVLIKMDNFTVQHGSVKM